VRQAVMGGLLLLGAPLLGLLGSADPVLAGSPAASDEIWQVRGPALSAHCSGISSKARSLPSKVHAVPTLPSFPVFELLRH
jgi:hypothetical protein